MPIQSNKPYEGTGNLFASHPNPSWQTKNKHVPKDLQKGAPESLRTAAPPPQSRQDKGLRPRQDIPASLQFGMPSKSGGHWWSGFISSSESSKPEGPVNHYNLSRDERPLRGYSNIRHPSESSNTFGLDDACYHNSAAALLNTDSSQLVDQTGHMQRRNGATHGHQMEIIRDAGEMPEGRYYDNSLHARRNLLDMPENEAFSFGYEVQGWRPGSELPPGHMVVGVRVGGDIHSIDYQQDPPTWGGFPPRDAKINSRYLVTGRAQQSQEMDWKNDSNHSNGQEMDWEGSRGGSSSALRADQKEYLKYLYKDNFIDREQYKSAKANSDEYLRLVGRYR